MILKHSCHIMTRKRQPFFREKSLFTPMTMTAEYFTTIWSSPNTRRLSPRAPWSSTLFSRPPEIYWRMGIWKELIRMFGKLMPRQKYWKNLRRKRRTEADRFILRQTIRYVEHYAPALQK